MYSIDIHIYMYYNVYYTFTYCYYNLTMPCVPSAVRYHRHRLNGYLA